MNLSHDDSKLFFKLMWQLQFYVGKQLNLLPNIDSVEAYIKTPIEQKQKARDAMYQKRHLIEKFADENPAKFSAEEIEIVRGWTKAITDEHFCVFRYLKRHAIFMSSSKPVQVYAVLGLFDPIEYLTGYRPPPFLVKAVLLPFKGRIIYDGMFALYSITFGAGFRGSYNETYMRAKQRGAILESLDPQVVAPVEIKTISSELQSAVNVIAKLSEKLGKADSKVQSQAFSVLKLSARLAQLTVNDPDNLDELYKSGKRIYKATLQFEKVVDREEGRDG